MTPYQANRNNLNSAFERSRAEQLSHIEQAERDVWLRAELNNLLRRQAAFILGLEV